MNKDVGFCLSKSWKPLICSLKKIPQHDARYLLRDHIIIEIYFSPYGPTSQKTAVFLVTALKISNPAGH
jgi:hypothetical protein